MQNLDEKARLKELYIEKLRPELKEKLGLKNIMAVPELEKIVLNIGLKDRDSKVFDYVLDMLGKISGQKPVITKAKKSIAGFKIREGMPLGVKVTLRRGNMYAFLDKLINLALPKVRDFQGVPISFDKFGNYNLGIKEWNIFPEADTTSEKIYGLNITFNISAKEPKQSYELLKSFGMPFKKNK